MLPAVGASLAIGGLPSAAAHFAAIAGGVWINLAALVTDEPEHPRLARRLRQCLGAPLASGTR